MINEIEFFSTNQRQALISLQNKIIDNYNVLGGNLKHLPNNDKLKTPLQEFLNKLEVICFHRGDPLSVVPFMKRVATGKLRGLGKPDGDAFASLEDTFLGIGHFRNGTAYTLDENELKAIRVYLSGHSLDVAKTEFKYKGLTISAVLFKSGVTFPNSGADKLLHNMFKVTITNESGVSTKFDFYGSYNDYISGITELKDLELLNAFECFINDSISANEDFEEWCSNFGYDTDSRKAHKIYKECQKSLEKAEKIISGDLYEFYNELQEMINS